MRDSVGHDRLTKSVPKHADLAVALVALIVDAVFHAPRRMGE